MPRPDRLHNVLPNWPLIGEIEAIEIDINPYSIKLGPVAELADAGDLKSNIVVLTNVSE